MKNLELYKKYKTSYSPLVNTDLRLIIIAVFAALLVEPLIMYKYHQTIPFSLSYYLRQIEYFSFIVIPFSAFLLWSCWREKVKQKRGYSWIGKFEVQAKQRTFINFYLLLQPGDTNRIKVDRTIFNKIVVGDFVVVLRDALGNIEEVRKADNFSSRVVRAAVRRSPKQLVRIPH